MAKLKIIFYDTCKLMQTKRKEEKYKIPKKDMIIYIYSCDDPYKFFNVKKNSYGDETFRAKVFMYSMEIKLFIKYLIKFHSTLV